MRLSDYVLQRVMTRDVPKPVSTRNPAILMKLDIEGSELEVLTDMIVSGGLQVKSSNVYLFDNATMPFLVPQNSFFLFLSQSEFIKPVSPQADQQGGILLTFHIIS